MNRGEHVGQTRTSNSATRFKVAVSGEEKQLLREVWKYKMAAKYFTVDEVRELVIEDTTDDNLDEDGEYEESDGFEEVMRQKLEELAEFAAEIQPEFDEDTFKTSTL